MAILLTSIKLPFVIKVFLLSIFEWPFKIVFTVPTSKELAQIFQNFNFINRKQKGQVALEC